MNAEFLEPKWLFSCNWNYLAGFFFNIPQDNAPLNPTRMAEILRSSSSRPRRRIRLPISISKSAPPVPWWIWYHTPAVTGTERAGWQDSRHSAWLCHMCWGMSRARICPSWRPRRSRHYYTAYPAVRILCVYYVYTMCIVYTYTYLGIAKSIQEILSRFGNLLPHKGVQIDRDIVDVDVHRLASP